MKKEDLRAGMVVEIRDGKHSGILAMVMPYQTGELCVSSYAYYSPLKYFQDDLTRVDYDVEITKVFGFSCSTRSAGDCNIEHRELLWERKGVKELTVAEIEELLGYPIKVVK